ncbi:MAG: hypothetical protein J7L77_08205, partial [Clostridiales bacterium]|nr:hypothetical protein [Clostridiales bacterium]
YIDRVFNKDKEETVEEVVVETEESSAENFDETVEADDDYTPDSIEETEAEPKNEAKEDKGINIPNFLRKL